MNKRPDVPHAPGRPSERERKKKLQRPQREEAYGEVEREKGGRKVSPSNLFGHWRAGGTKRANERARIKLHTPLQVGIPGQR